MNYTKHIYHEELGDYVVDTLTAEECRDYLTRYYYDNEMLDYMISVEQRIPVMCGYVEITE